MISSIHPACFPAIMFCDSSERVSDITDIKIFKTALEILCATAEEAKRSYALHLTSNREIPKFLLQSFRGISSDSNMLTGERVATKTLKDTAKNYFNSIVPNSAAKRITNTMREAFKKNKLVIPSASFAYSPIMLFVDPTKEDEQTLLDYIKISKVAVKCIFTRPISTHLLNAETLKWNKLEGIERLNDSNYQTYEVSRNCSSAVVSTSLKNKDAASIIPTLKKRYYSTFQSKIQSFLKEKLGEVTSGLDSLTQIVQPGPLKEIFDLHTNLDSISFERWLPPFEDLDFGTKDFPEFRSKCDFHLRSAKTQLGAVFTLFDEFKKDLPGKLQSECTRSFKQLSSENNSYLMRYFSDKSIEDINAYLKTLNTNFNEFETKEAFETSTLSVDTIKTLYSMEGID